MLCKNQDHLSTNSFIFYKIAVEKLPCVPKVEDNSFWSPVNIKSANKFYSYPRYKISVNSC